MNLSRVIQRADQISNDFRTAIHIDMTTSKSAGRITAIRDLLETDNVMRDVIAQLRLAMSKLTINANSEQTIRDEIFLKDLYENLTSMFRSLDDIYSYINVEEGDIDQLVLQTIDSIDMITHY